MRIKVRAAFAAANRQSRQRILVDLLKCEEFQNIERHAWMEAQTALVWSERAGHLYTKPTVDLDLALVVHPRHAECDDAIRLDHALKNLVLLVLRMLLQKRNDGCQNLGNCVLEMRLIGIALRYQIENIIDILFHVRHYNSSLLLARCPSSNVTEYSTRHKGLYRDYRHEYNMHLKYKKEASAFLQKPLVLQMIWLSPADLKSSIDLLHQEKSDQLMRECEVRE